MLRGSKKLVKLSNCGKQGIQTNDHGGHQHAVTAVNKVIIGLDALISNVFSYGIEYIEFRCEKLQKFAVALK